MEQQGPERSKWMEPARWRWVRRYGWLALLVPLLAYAGAIGLAYWRPLVEISGVSTSTRGSPAMAVFEVRNRGPLPVVVESVEVAGVLPPDEIALAWPVMGSLPTVHPAYAQGERTAAWPQGGWRLEPLPEPPREVPGILLIWYPTVDLRWLHCPTIRYRYLGWPMVARGYCREALRGPALHYGTAVPPDWGEWQSAGGGVRYRLQRTEEDLFIEVGPEPGQTPGEIVLNDFWEEPGGGRARFGFRFITITDRPSRVTQLISVPLRWGEPDPALDFEVLTIEEWRERY